MIVVKVGGGKDLNIDAVVARHRHAARRGQGAAARPRRRRDHQRGGEALGHPPQFVTSESGYVSRRTDRRTLEIFEMVYCGQLNKMWVEKLQGAGVNAVGLSGLDGRIFEGTRKDTLRVRIDGKRHGAARRLDGHGGTCQHASAAHAARRRLLSRASRRPARRTRARRSTWTATAPRPWWRRPSTPKR